MMGLQSMHDTAIVITSFEYILDYKYRKCDSSCQCVQTADHTFQQAHPCAAAEPHSPKAPMMSCNTLTMRKVCATSQTTAARLQKIMKSTADMPKP